MALVIGLTGGIGSGKSTVADLFAERGAGVVDTDQIAHALTAPGGTGIPEIRRQFGDDFLEQDGRMNRVAMRQLVFTDPTAKNRLEAILHPMIRAEVTAQISGSTSPYTLIVVPLLVETGAYQGLIQRTLVVDCPEEVQIARTMKRSGLSRQEVEAIMSRQAPRSQRLSAADDVIDNANGIDGLVPQVAQLHRSYLDLIN